MAGSSLGPDALERWRQVIAPDDPGFFERRLAWDGLDAAALASGAGGTYDLAWIDWVVAGLDGATSPRAMAGEVPFGEALAGFVNAAWRRLAHRLPPTLPVGEPLERDFEGVLASRLGEIAAPTLLAAFDRARGSAATDTMPPGNTAYSDFIAWLTGGGWRTVFQTWPVLARLMGTAMGQWADDALALLTDFAADHAELAHLAQAANPATTLGAIARARVASDDLHAGGRAVWRVETEAGLAFYYKPRSIAMEDRFEALLQALAGHGLPLAGRRLLRLDRGTHGWVEELQPLPCDDVAAVDRYFFRAGALLAVFHALGGSDFHWENLIAVGEHPMVIDLEGLLQPGLDGDDGAGDATTSLQTIRARLDAGVLATLMLTFWSVLPDGTPMDWGGLSAPPPAALREVWLDVNTDRMRRGTALYTAERPNLPRLADQVCLASAHAARVRAGFHQAYGMLVAEREALLAPGGAVAAFAGCPVRFFYRTTQHYARLLRRGLEPDLLTDGLARSFAFDRLARTYRAWTDRPPLWPLIRSERLALERGDVPCFTLPAEATALPLAGENLPCFGTSPLARARTRLAALGPTDEAIQDRAIAIALAPGELLPADAAPATDAPAPREAGLALARTLAERAFVMSDGARAWIVPQPHPRAAAPIPGLAGFGGWDGAPGLALFLAAAHRAGGGAALGEAARGAMRPVRQAIAAGAARHAAGGPAVAAWASTARMLAVGARLLDEPGWADDARAVVRTLPVGTFQCISAPDASGGLADVLSSLLGVHRELGDEAALALAVRVGDRLLALATPGELAARGWSTESPAGDRLAGFAHGQAGIAAALVRLHALTGTNAYRTAALESLAYEDALFDAALANWTIKGAADAEGRPVAWVSWCHGATGVALSRLVLGEHDPTRRRELDTAIDTVLAAPDHLLDLPCCGNFGRVEVLHTLGRALGREDLVAHAHALAGRRHAVAAFGTDPPRRNLDLDGSFLRGLAGIGYTTLRLALPEELPCMMGADG